MPTRVIVDENAGPGTRLWEAFQQALGEAQREYVFLSEEHRAIPDVEILDKLLQPDDVLLTADCVLHTRALERGCRSYSLNDRGQLTRKRLPHVRKLKPLPTSVHTQLLDDYAPHPTHDLARRLKSVLTERQFKRYRTARRRIRSYFGSAAAISQVSVTVGSLTTSRGQLCGFVFRLAGHSGVKGLRASEGYCCAPGSCPGNAAWPLLHALRDQYLLQLDDIRTDMFIIPGASFKLAGEIRDTDNALAEPVREAARQLIRQLPNVTLHPCGKGRFHDAMQSKLKQLVRTRSNELMPLDLDAVARQFLEAESSERSPSRE